MNKRLADERIAFIQEQVETAKAEGENMFSLSTFAVEALVSDLRHYKKLAEERGAVLEWYANEDIYTDGEIGFHDKSTAEYDRGDRAWQALGKDQQT